MKSKVTFIRPGDLTAEHIEYMRNWLNTINEQIESLSGLLRNSAANILTEKLIAEGKRVTKFLNIHAGRLIDNTYTCIECGLDMDDEQHNYGLPKEPVCCFCYDHEIVLNYILS